MARSLPSIPSPPSAKDQAPSLNQGLRGLAGGGPAGGTFPAVLVLAPLAGTPRTSRLSPFGSAGAPGLRSSGAPGPRRAAPRARPAAPGLMSSDRCPGRHDRMGPWCRWALLARRPPERRRRPQRWRGAEDPLQPPFRHRPRQLEGRLQAQNTSTPASSGTSVRRRADSPQVRGVGKIFSGLARFCGSKAWRTRPMVARSSGVNIQSM